MAFNVGPVEAFVCCLLGRFRFYVFRILWIYTNGLVVWTVYGRYMDGIWTMYGRYRDGIWTVYGRYRDGVGTV